MTTDSLSTGTPAAQAVRVGLEEFTIEVPSWAFGNSGTRFKVFFQPGVPRDPFEKVAGTLDIELDDGTGDAEYLDALAGALPRVLRDAQPDLVLYLAGADPHEGDRLGRMRLSFGGLERRDAMVLESCREVGLPVAVMIAGGYGRRIEDTVAVHVATARIVAGIG